MLLKYYHIAKTLIDNFEYFKMYYILRDNNTRADLLYKLARTKKTGHLKTIVATYPSMGGRGEMKNVCLPKKEVA